MLNHVGGTDTSVVGFLSDEYGGITVDWTTLAAGIGGVALAVMSVIATGLGESTHELEEKVSLESNIAPIVIHGAAGGQATSDDDPEDDDGGAGSDI